MNDSRDFYQEAEDAYAEGNALKDKADKLMKPIKGMGTASKEVQSIIIEASVYYQSARLLFYKSAKLYEEAAKHPKP
jgi:hypothetical protein